MDIAKEIGGYSSTSTDIYARASQRIIDLERCILDAAAQLGEDHQWSQSWSSTLETIRFNERVRCVQPFTR